MVHCPADKLENRENALKILNLVILSGIHRTLLGKCGNNCLKYFTISIYSNSLSIYSNNYLTLRLYRYRQLIVLTNKLNLQL